mmetsp:Transcript_87093/g.247133  ORF Transcript_87093/g.247133 Transcript_87093/m.247133 type:complete len:223 (+) Transcript_87093:414-1082(+)
MRFFFFFSSTHAHTLAHITPSVTPSLTHQPLADKGDGLLVTHEIPQPIRPHHNKLILLRPFHYRDFGRHLYVRRRERLRHHHPPFSRRVVIELSAFQEEVTEAARGLKPAFNVADIRRRAEHHVLFPRMCLEQRHLLPWVAAVMVYAQRHRGHRLALPFSDRGLLSPQHRPAVTRVGADDLVGPYHQHHPARADLGHVRESLVEELPHQLDPLVVQVDERRV